MEIHSRSREDPTSPHLLRILWYRRSDSKTISHLSFRPDLAPGEAIKLLFHFQPFFTQLGAPLGDFSPHWKLLKRQVHFFGLSPLFWGVDALIKKQNTRYSHIQSILQVLTHFLVPC